MRTLLVVALLCGILHGQPAAATFEVASLKRFVLDWLFEPPAGYPEALLPPPDARTGIPLPAALQTQLGLHLEKRNFPVDVLVIDRVDRIPVEN